ncbi:MAG: NitT/TauT family transport system ATP-binding protein [Alphaproteobacteria bacterium]|jgi:NitT/TauT family transport system ATP-binding protein|nr:NitT/TauT family transport system ATP-binding protein [Alphaproteobacteria bacterium]
MTSGTDFNPVDPALTRMADRGVGPAISFQDVSKHFPAADGSRLEVLRDVSFDVRIGDVVAIVGPSGSGKSTLLNMAAGLIFPDAGQVVVMGQSTDAAVDWSHVGYMFQDDRLLPWRVAVRNVALALEAGSMPAAERLRRARAVLDLVGLGGFEHSYPHQLSGGMRSRVALARSLVGEPQILLMDEPFSRLDAQTRSSMHRELLRIHAMRAMTILFVTHDVEEAVVLADHVVMMSARPGRVRRTIDITLPQPRIGTPGAVALTAELRASLEAEPSQEAQT